MTEDTLLKNVVIDIIRLLFVMNAMKNGYTVSILQDGTMRFTTTYLQHPEWWENKDTCLSRFIESRGKYRKLL